MIILKKIQIAGLYPEYLNTETVKPVELTTKETEILMLLRQGMNSEEICTRCHITYNSLKFHNRNVYKKLGVKNRHEAERKAIMLGI